MLVSPIQRRWDSLTVGTRSTGWAVQSKGKGGCGHLVLRSKCVLDRLTGRIITSKTPSDSPST
jgi:hypothetical protein